MHPRQLFRSHPERPAHKHPPRARPAVSFSVSSRSAGDADVRGGDVFEPVLRPDGSVSVLVADISSKGVLGLAHADMLRRRFRLAARDTFSPARIMADLDLVHFDCGRASQTVTFASAFVASFGRVGAQLSYTSAGHGAALLVDGPRHRHLDPNGPLLGILAAPERIESSVSFGAGELLVIFTDGITECRNVALDSMQFGSAGVARALAFDKTRSCRSAAEMIVHSADVFSGRRYRDDATVAVIKRAGS